MEELQAIIQEKEPLNVVQALDADTKEEVDKEVHAGTESDETFDSPCQPCLSEDKNVESRKYCVNCEEYLCENCAEFHKRFKHFKKHQLLNKVDIQINEPGIPVIKPLETCSRHLEKKIELFCKSHDKLCCSFCQATDHRECDDVILLTEAANGVRDSEEFRRVIDQLEVSQSDLNDIIFKRENNSVRLVSEKDDAMKVLEKSANDMIELVNKLRKADEKRINSKLETDLNMIQKDINNSKEVVIMLKNHKETLEKDNVDDMSKFTQMKRAQQNVESAKKVISPISQNVGSENIVYVTDNCIYTSLEGFKGFGTLKCENRVYKKSSSEKISIFQKNKTKTTIMSICILKNGWIVMNDWDNRQLKLLNISSKTVATCKVECVPWDVCVVEDNKVAVTMLYLSCVQFFSVNIANPKSPSLKPSLSEDSEDGKYFSTVEKCRGMVYLDLKLYVACGGGKTGNEGPGHIRVFNLNGDLLRSIGLENLKTNVRGSPRRIAVSPVSRELYVSDLELGWLKFRSEESAFPCVIRKDKVNMGGLAFDEHDHMFKADFERNVVEQFGSNGKFVGTVLTEEDGIKKPYGVAYDTKTRQLFVGMKDSSDLHLYQLDYD